MKVVSDKHWESAGRIMMALLFGLTASVVGIVLWNNFIEADSVQPIEWSGPIAIEGVKDGVPFIPQVDGFTAPSLTTQQDVPFKGQRCTDYHSNFEAITNVWWVDVERGIRYQSTMDRQITVEIGCQSIVFEALVPGAVQTVVRDIGGIDRDPSIWIIEGIIDPLISNGGRSTFESEQFLLVDEPGPINNDTDSGQ